MTTTLMQGRRESRVVWRWQLNDTVLEPLFTVLTLLGIISGLLLEHVGASVNLIRVINMVTYIFGSYYAVRAILENLREWKIEVDLLMVLAALGAAYIDAWTEGAILLFLFSLSNVLQNYALGRTKRAISALLQLRPDEVTIRRGDDLVTIPLDEVQVEDIYVLRPGDRVALDAVIVQGSGNFDESSITGESMPLHKTVGAPVLAGTVNQNGALDVQVTKLASESTLARIVAMVSEAQERKARTESFLDRFEQWYAMGIIGAVGLFIVLVPMLLDRDFSQNFYTAMVLLTVASPCALVISVPASLLSAIASAARRGVLFKGGAHLEDLSQIKVVAFDKTGTLTYGKPEVADVIPQRGVSEDELLSAVVRAEQASEHPIARAIMDYADRLGIRVDEAEVFEAIPGMGIRTMWDGVETLVGSPRLMEHYGQQVPADLREAVDWLGVAGRGTVLLVNRGGRWLGIITVMDRERPDAAMKIADLRRAGVERIVMLTGDNRSVARAMAQQLGVDEVYAELLPHDKLRLVEELQERYGPVAMVGDGINDAPALAAAHTGIAMGAAGTDVALETADVVLMSDDLGAIEQAITLSKRSQRVVWQNIAFALSVVVVLVTLTLTVGVPLPLGVVGHEGSTILVVLNGLRLLADRA